MSIFIFNLYSELRLFSGPNFALRNILIQSFQAFYSEGPSGGKPGFLVGSFKFILFLFFTSSFFLSFSTVPKNFIYPHFLYLTMTFPFFRHAYTSVYIYDYQRIGQYQKDTLLRKPIDFEFKQTVILLCANLSLLITNVVAIP